MRISTKCRYGVSAVIDMAIHREEGMLLIGDIAKRLEISTGYLEHIIMPLVSAGIVRSNRGAKGGVRLAQPPENTKLIDIFRIYEGPIAIVDCVSDSSVCHRSSSCVTRELWTKLAAEVSKVLASRTVADIAKSHQVTILSIHPCNNGKYDGILDKRSPEKFIQSTTLGDLFT